MRPSSVDVGEPRHVVERQRLAGEQAGDHQGQRRILGAADRYGALERLTADNADPVHDDVRSLQVHLPDCEVKQVPRCFPKSH